MIIVLREREGKSGGGKGFLLSDKSFTLSSSNFQTLFMTEPMAFHHKQDPISGDVSPALGTTSDGMGVMAFDSYNQSLSETSQTIRKGQAGNDHVGMVMEKSVVRRLTPTECERLQGFPDGWTEGQADSHRYKQMGNAVAVPVVQWIINRMTQ